MLDNLKIWDIPLSNILIISNICKGNKFLLSDVTVIFDKVKYKWSLVINYNYVISFKTE